MKKTILKTIAAILFVCLVVDLAPSLLDNTGAGWINLDSLSMRHNFYIGKRQWLADARTVMAAVRYLYRTRSAEPAEPINIVSNAPLAAVKPAGSLTLVVIGDADSAIVFRERRLSRLEKLIVFKRLLSSDGLPGSEPETRNHATKARTRILRSITLPTNAAAPVSGIIVVTPT